MTAPMKSQRKKSRRPKKNLLGMIVIAILVALLAGYFAILAVSQPNVSGDRLTYTGFLELVAANRVEDAKILDQDAYIVGTYYPGPGEAVAAPAESSSHSGMGAPMPPPEPREVVSDTEPHRYAIPYLRAMSSRESLVVALVEAGVPLTIDQQVGKSLVSPLTALIPALMVVVVMIYLILSYQRGTGLFGIRSGARKIEAEHSTKTFADVAGQDLAVTELRELVQFVAAPERYVALGAIIPKGILLYGPPGCGKTLMARALAGEAGASFYSISGSDFVELYVGVGAARVRDLFTEARANAPAIVFIDELDSVGRRRGGSSTSGHGSGEEQEQALNQILAELDGFGSTSGVIVVGATNRPDILDPALLRPGRFDRSVGLERPDEAGRLAILKVHAQGKVLDPSVDLAVIANRAFGLSGADLAGVVNEAALLAGRAGRATITQGEFDLALQRILEAPERQRRLSMRDRDVGRRHVSGEHRVTFADVAGVEEVVDELSEVRQYLAEPDHFAKMGARVPKGILMDGPPGCGKTLLARALAGESNAAFLYVAGSEFTELFVGEGAGRVRDLFSEAKAVAPSIVFIDEIDAIGGRRSNTPGGHGEREQTLNQILIELDGFEVRTGVIAIAATNRPDILDPALVRPGRFDRHVTINLPSRARRLAILSVHAKDKPLAADVDLATVAALTQGFSGADLANVLNEAVLLASRRHLTQVPMTLVEEAIERAIVGVAPQFRIASDRERKMIAYHEAGHAIVGRVLPGATVPHRLTVVPRGKSLGATWLLDERDVLVHSRSSLIDQMASALGGRVAEEMVFGEPSSGAADDLIKVSQIARRMVSELGMSDALGPVVYTGESGDSHSEKAAALIDVEVRDLIGQAQQKARQVLESSRSALNAVAAALAESEVLTAEEFEQIAAPLLVKPRGRGTGRAPAAGVAQLALRSRGASGSART